MSRTTDLAARAVGAGAWTVGTRLLVKLIDFALLLCLARFLGPAEFGVVAMAMAAVFIVEALFELPVVAALIRAPELTQPALQTAFTLGLIRGLLIALVLLCLAWPMASFNDEPRLALLVAVLALAPALRGMVSPRMVEYARSMNFRPDAALELSGKAVAFALSITIAVSTGSYWAIAAATVCTPLVSTALSYWFAPMRPKLTLSEWPQFSSLVGWNFVTQLFSALNWQIDRLLLPRLTTASGFGQYAMSKQISEIPVQALMAPLHRPAMAAFASDTASLGRRYLQLSHATALVMVPVMGVPLLWPEVLLHLALGSEWVAAAEWLRWMSLVVLLGVPSMLLAPLAMTLDRTRWVATRTFLEFATRLPAVALGAAWFGIPGAIAGSAIATTASTLCSLLMVRSLGAITLRHQVGAGAGPLMAWLPAAALLHVTLPVVDAAANSLDMATRALLLLSLYALVYGVGAWLIWRIAGRPPGLERQVLDRAGALWRGMRLRAAPMGRSGPTTPADHPRKIYVNGRFLMSAGAPSGVQRVAHELILALDALLGADRSLRAAVRCQVIVPGGKAPALTLSDVAIHVDPAPTRLLKALPWEQLILPWRARRGTLVSLCNLGPMFSGDALTMVHDAQVHSSPGSYSRAFRLWYRLVQPRLGRRNRAILTVSHHSRQQLALYGVCTQERIRVVHNGCNHVTRLRPDSTIQSDPALQAQPYVLALANTQDHKNIRILLQAFRLPALSGVTLALFGGAQKADFERSGHEVPANVRFLGRISDEALAALLPRAVALAFPSLTEGFGLPPLEAMALGCPVVAAPCGALPEVCGDAALWADPHDAGQWADRLARLRDDPMLASSMRAGGVAHAAAFTWQRAARQVLESALGSPLAQFAAEDAAAARLLHASSWSPPNPSLN